MKEEAMTDDQPSWRLRLMGKLARSPKEEIMATNKGLH
jgi:hypothetical protein